MRNDKPKALDLFCKAGGATRGLQQAGFHVTGVDIHRQPNYVGDAFIKANALEVDLRGYAFIWASPPCQAFTAYKRRPGHVRERANLIPDIRENLEWSGALFSIENVADAPLVNPVMLCGSMFGLDVRRHRLFETNFRLPARKCEHEWQFPKYPPATNRKNLRSTVEVGVWRIPLATQQKAMAIDWMTLPELSEAIPPPYARYIGECAMQTLGYW